MAEVKKIGRYIVENILGEGAMGSVYKARDPNLERTVAIKTMRTSNIGKNESYEEFKQRFFLESRVNGRLNHPNIVAVYDSGMVEKDPYLVMEFIDGKPLDFFIESQGERYLACYLDLMSQIASGLDYAHDEGVVHRDVKPGNILVTTSRTGYRAKLVDFGLAKLKDSKLTQTGYFLGTPSYASPEQVLSGKLDARSDIFSFGIVAYEMLTGLLPFDAESLHAILYKIANEPPKLELERFTDFIDIHALSYVFRTILQKEPQARYQSAGQFIEELRVLVTPLHQVRLPAARSSRRHSEPALDRTSLAPRDEPRDTRMEQIREVRALFQEALRTKNLSSSRYCLDELKKLGAPVETESDALDKLVTEIKRQRNEKRRLEHAKLVKKARDQFELALKTRNLQSVRYCLQELDRLKVDIVREHAALAQLEQELQHEQDERDRQENEQRERYIQKRRQQLEQALDEQDVQRSGILLKELGSLLKVDVTRERQLLQEIKDKQAKDEEVTRTRSAFLDALASKDAKKCRGVIARLSELGANLEQEKRALAALEKQLEKEDHKQLKVRVVARTRDAFRDALQRKNLESCHYYLRELTQMSVDVSSEERALESLVRYLEEQEAHRLKEAMTVKLREEFRKAYDHRNLESCRYYIRELNFLAASADEEKLAVAELEKAIRAEDELANNMISQVRAIFEKAVAEDDVKAANQYFKALTGLGANVDREKKALIQLKRKATQNVEQDQLRAKLVSQFRGKFKEGYDKRNRDTCKYYLKELMQLGVDVAEENTLLASMETA